jgi:transposase-like protein
MSEALKEQLANVKIGNLRHKHQKNRSYPLEKKVEVVSQYLVLGNMKLVAAMTGVDYGLIRQWKIQPWWMDLEREIRATQNIAVDNKLSKIIERSMDATLDRLEEGEVLVDKKTGKTYRQPVSMKDAAKVTNDFLTRQAVLRKAEESVEQVSTTSVVDQLKALATEFSKWSNKQNAVDIVDVETIEVTDAISEERGSPVQTRVGVGAQDPSEPSEGTGREEQSALGDDESGESP